MNPSREFLVFRGKEIIGSVGWWSDTWASAESGEGWRRTRSHLGLSLCRRFGGSENHGEYIKYQGRVDVGRPATTSTRKEPSNSERKDETSSEESSRSYKLKGRDDHCGESKYISSLHAGRPLPLCQRLMPGASCTSMHQDDS